MAKTVKISDVVTLANRRLAADVHVDTWTPEQAYRLGVASLLEQILHANGQYRGFGYAQADCVEGIPDETRRIYGC